MARMSDQILDVLDCHQYALGWEGIVHGGQYAYLECICGWKLNYEMPGDNMRLAEVAWEKHQADMIAAHFGSD